MNLFTLIHLCRPDVITNYGEKYIIDTMIRYYNCSESDCVIDSVMEKKYTLVDTYVDATKSVYALDKMDAIYILRNEENGDLIRVTTRHDSWTEDPIENFQCAVIEKVESVEVTAIDYQETGKVELEDM